MRRLYRLLLALIFVAPTLASAQELAPTDGGRRVRPTDPRLAEILADGIRRSPTMRALVEQIEASNVIVYIESEQKMPGIMLGSITWIGATDALRFVRMSIKVRPKSNALIASIGHELQHVVEVVRAPWVTDDKSLRQLYSHIGKRTGMSDDVWDTALARHTTDQVMRELNGLATVATDADER